MTRLGHFHRKLRTLLSAEISPARPAIARPLFPGWIARLVIAVTLSFAVLVRILGRAEDPPSPLNDPAIVNILTLIFSFVAVLTAWIWLCFRSGFSLLVRRLVFIGAFVLLAAFVFLFRFRDVSGNLVPSFELRWGSTAPDEKLKPLDSPAVGKPTADLARQTPDDFPQFLGPERSCWIAGPELARDWTASPPKLLWKRPIGAGWSAFAAVNGYAVTMEQRGEDEWVTCYEIATGNPVWGHAIDGRHENPMGGIGPRSTPTIHRGPRLCAGGDRRAAVPRRRHRQAAVAGRPAEAHTALIASWTTR